MATFIGTEKEFNDYVGPRVRNKNQTLTKKAKTARNNVCEHCGKTVGELDAAHVHGRERKAIVHELLQPYRDGDVYRVDLAAFEQALIKAHQPVKKVFLFLCRDCHVAYDSVPSVKASVMASTRASSPVNESGVTAQRVSKEPARRKELATGEVNETLRDVGKRFFLSAFELVYTHRDTAVDNSELAKRCKEKYERENPSAKKITSVGSRISVVKRIIETGNTGTALSILREESPRFLNDNPWALGEIDSLLARYPELMSSGWR